jgi:hypothetical protein
MAVKSFIKQYPGWKGLPETNTLPYFKNSLIMTVKRIITIGQGFKGLPETNSLAYFKKFIAFDKTPGVCHGQKLQLITNIRKLQT